MTSFVDMYRRQRASENRQNRQLLVGYIVSVDRSAFPFTATVRITEIGYTYDLPDCVATSPYREGTLLSGDVQPAGEPHTLREGQTVLLLTPGELDGQAYIIGEILNPTHDGDVPLKVFDAPMLQSADTFTDGGQLYQRVHNVNGQLGVKLNSNIAPVRFYYHD